MDHYLNVQVVEQYVYLAQENIGKSITIEEVRKRTGWLIVDCKLSPTLLLYLFVAD
jgi:hypothetical protein